MGMGGVGSSEASIPLPSPLGPMGARQSASSHCTPASEDAPGSRRSTATPSHIISFGGTLPSSGGVSRDGSPLTGLDIIDDLIKDESLSPAAVGEMLLQGGHLAELEGNGLGLTPSKLPGLEIDEDYMRMIKELDLLGPNEQI